MVDYILLYTKKAAMKDRFYRFIIIKPDSFSYFLL